jgi:D-psicose/D-tagatose/L-ribulose 3-epimerase
MKFGINTFLWTGNFGPEHFHLLPKIKEQGFDGIEVALIRPADFKAAEIRKAAAQNGLEVTVCSVLPGELSLISPDAEVRKKTVAHMSECLRACAEAGAKLVAGPLYSPVGYLPGRRRTAEEWKNGVDSWKQLAPALAANRMAVCLEPLNRFETYFLNTTADAVRFCAEIDDPNVGILWDTFHANIEEKDPAQALRSTGRFLKHVHTCENDRGTPGSGHVDWKGVFAALRDMKYDGWLTIESFGFAIGELSAAASIWRDLAATPEEIAFEGVKFLKAQTA